MTEPKWRRYLRFWKSDPRADAEEELAFHIESRIAELREEMTLEVQMRTEEEVTKRTDEKDLVAIAEKPAPLRKQIVLAMCARRHG